MHKRVVALFVTLIIASSAVCFISCGKSPKQVPKQDTGQIEHKSGEEGKDPGEGKELLKAYFPLTKSSIWKYQGEGNEYATFTREVIYVSGDKAQIEENNGGTVIAAVFEVTDNAVTRTFLQAETYERPYILDKEPNDHTIILKNPLELGTKWEESDKDPKVEREIIDVKAILDTPAGKFEDCIKVKIKHPDSTVYEYFKSGVGMVKREFISGDTKITSTLEQFTSLRNSS